MSLQSAKSLVGAERLQLALHDGVSANPDLNALRDGVVEYVEALLKDGASVTDTVVAVKSVVSRFNGEHGTHFAALAAQVVSWSIDEYYARQGT